MKTNTISKSNKLNTKNKENNFNSKQGTAQPNQQPSYQFHINDFFNILNPSNIFKQDEQNIQFKDILDLPQSLQQKVQEKQDSKQTEQKQKEKCQFYHESGFCQNGDKCKYQHILLEQQQTQQMPYTLSLMSCNFTQTERLITFIKIEKKEQILKI